MTVIRRAGPKRTDKREQTIIARAISDHSHLLNDGDSLGATRALIHAMHSLHNADEKKSAPGRADIPIELRDAALGVLRVQDLPHEVVVLFELLLDTRSAATGKPRNSRDERDPRWIKFARLCAELQAGGQEPNPNMLADLGQRRGIEKISPHTLKRWLCSPTFCATIKLERERMKPHREPPWAVGLKAELEATLKETGRSTRGSTNRANE